MDIDQSMMRLAIAQAELALRAGEVPVGAVVAVEDEVIAQSGNCPIQNNDPTAHAEIVVLRAAASVLNNYRLSEASLYVTLEPCAMCFGAMVHARIKRLVFGASDPKSGVVGGAVAWQKAEVFNHQIIISDGLMAIECAAILKQFFVAKR